MDTSGIKLVHYFSWRNGGDIESIRYYHPSSYPNLFLVLLKLPVNCSHNADIYYCQTFYTVFVG